MSELVPSSIAGSRAAVVSVAKGAALRLTSGSSVQGIVGICGTQAVTAHAAPKTQARLNMLCPLITAVPARLLSSLGVSKRRRLSRALTVFHQLSGAAETVVELDVLVDDQLPTVRADIVDVVVAPIDFGRAGLCPTVGQCDGIVRPAVNNEDIVVL